MVFINFGCYSYIIFPIVSLERVGTIGIISTCDRMNMEKQCAIFIDAGYVNKACKTMNFRIDYLKFSDYLASKIGCYRFKTFYYDCPPYQDEKSSEEERAYYNSKLRFFDAIKYLPRFEVVFGKLQRISKEDKTYQYNQKMVDTLLSLDLVTSVYNKHISNAVVVSGDSDFVPAVKHAKTGGAIVYAAYFKEENKKSMIHDQLKQECDDRLELSSNEIKLFRK